MRRTGLGLGTTSFCGGERIPSGGTVTPALTCSRKYKNENEAVPFVRVSLSELRGEIPVERKSAVTVLTLFVMGGALLTLGRPFGFGIFSLGVLLLGSDYELLAMVGLDSMYEWVESRDTLHKRIERNYRAKKFLEEGPDRLDVHPQTGGDFRAHVPDGEYVFEGMPFRVYVEAPSPGTVETLEYHLQIASAKVTRISDTSGRAVVVFLTVTEWVDRFEDDVEKRIGQSVQHELELGDGDVRPFAKVKLSERADEFDLEEWRIIYEWSVGKSTRKPPEHSKDGRSQ